MLKYKSSLFCPLVYCFSWYSNQHLTFSPGKRWLQRWPKRQWNTLGVPSACASIAWRTSRHQDLWPAYVHSCHNREGNSMSPRQFLSFWVTISSPATRQSLSSLFPCLAYPCFTSFMLIRQLATEGMKLCTRVLLPWVQYQCSRWLYHLSTSIFLNSKLCTISRPAGSIQWSISPFSIILYIPLNLHVEKALYW